MIGYQLAFSTPGISPRSAWPETDAAHLELADEAARATANAAAVALAI